IGINLAAVLSALFTFLFCKALGQSPIGAAVSSWTFACAGFFASRVMAGHLPLLEAYPALPLLLLLIETIVARRRDVQPVTCHLCALAVATACAALAGHPQIPAYAIGAAVAYLFWRGGLPNFRLPLTCIVLGACTTLFLWHPMALLILRSTRVLPL